jgi:hypothetical protein
VLELRRDVVSGVRTEARGLVARPPGHGEGGSLANSAVADAERRPSRHGLRVIWAGAVYELVEAEPDLRVLEERDFVRRRPGSSMGREPEYAIKHALTHELAYASLPKAQRARMQSAFAAWLERIGQGRDGLAPLLAHHYGSSPGPMSSPAAGSRRPPRSRRAGRF